MFCYQSPGRVKHCVIGVYRSLPFGSLSTSMIDKWHGIGPNPAFQINSLKVYKMLQGMLNKQDQTKNYAMPQKTISEQNTKSLV